MSSGDLFVIACLMLTQSLVTCQEVDCSLDSPELWLKDIAGELHNFRENITEITELQLEKGAAVSTTAGSGELLRYCCKFVTFTNLHFTGECCFALFSESDGEGTEQLLEYDTETMLEIETVKSAFIVECYK